MVPIRVFPSLALVSLLVIATLAPLPLGAAGDFEAAAESEPLPPVGPDPFVRLVVGYDQHLPEGAQHLILHHGGKVLRVDPRLDFAVVLAPAVAKEALVDGLRFVPGVTYAKEDGRMEALFTPDDPRYADQWGPAAIGMEAAWDVARGNHSIEVAVLDTGVDYRHNDLEANVCRLGPDFVNDDADPADDHYHGTHVAGTVAAQIDNGVGVAGMADVCVVPVKVLSAGGSGHWSDLASAIQWSADNETEIISMSLGGCCDPGPPLTTAVQNAAQAGVLIIAAAGNAHCSPVGYPAAYPEIVAVGSLDAPGDQVSSFSSCGPEVEVSAPGRDIISTMPGQGYASLSGTSMATPHTSGVAALFWSQFPALSADQVRCVLAQNADDLLGSGPDEQSGFGRIDAPAMLANPNCVPKAPAAPIVVGVSGDGTAALGWNKPHAWGGVDGYRVYRTTATDPTPVLVAEVNTTQYEDTAVSVGTTYTYTVVAYNGAGNSSESDPIAVEVRSAVTLPYAEGFEAGLGEWEATGPWHVTSDRAGSGERSVYFGRENGPGLDDNDYPDNTRGTLTSPPIRVPENGSAHAVFWQYAELEHWFYEFPFIELATTDDPFAFTPVWSMGGHDIYEGQGALDLAPYAGQVVYFRFVVDTDFCCGGEGWYLDDLTVQTGPAPDIAPVLHVQWPIAGDVAGGSHYVAATYLDGNGDSDVVNATIRFDDGALFPGALLGHMFYAPYDGIPSGNHTLTATVRDASGLDGTQVLQVRIDADPPTIETVVPDQGTPIGCVAQLGGTASDTGGAGLAVVYAHRPDLDLEGADHTTFWYFDGEDSASWFLNVTTAYVPQGPFNLTLHLFDRAGNHHAFTHPLQRDDTHCLPDIQVTGPADDAVVGGLVAIEGVVDWPSEDAAGDVLVLIDGIQRAAVHTTGAFSYTWNAWNAADGDHTIEIMAVEDATGLFAVRTIEVMVFNDRSPRVDIVEGAGLIGCSAGFTPIHSGDVCGDAGRPTFDLEPGLTGVHIVVTWDEDTLGLDRIDATMLIGVREFRSESHGPGVAVINATAPDGMWTDDFRTALLDVRAASDGALAVAVDEAFTYRAELHYWGSSP